MVSREREGEAAERVQAVSRTKPLRAQASNSEGGGWGAGLGTGRPV